MTTIWVSNTVTKDDMTSTFRVSVRVSMIMAVKFVFFNTHIMVLIFFLVHVRTLPWESDSDRVGTKAEGNWNDNKRRKRSEWNLGTTNDTRAKVIVRSKTFWCLIAYRPRELAVNIPSQLDRKILYANVTSVPNNTTNSASSASVLWTVVRLRISDKSK